MSQLNAALVSNGIEGLERLFAPNDKIVYTVLEVDAGFDPDLSGFDVLIAPNGTDHVALFRIRDRVKAFLDRGGALMCFDGWFTDWIPGHRWVMDNTKKTIDVRYQIRDDNFGIGKTFSIGDLNFSHGISGWWSCGYIEPAAGADVLIEDTWGRPLVVVDTSSFAGPILLTASGPLGDFSYATTDDEASYSAMADLYQGFVNFLYQRQRLAV